MYDVHIMHRTQLLIEPWQHERLKLLSEREGRSISAIVRELLSEFLRDQSKKSGHRLSDIQGVAEGPPDLGRSHDDHLYGRKRDA